MHEIDASFKQRKVENAARRRRARQRKWIGAGLASFLTIFGVGFFFTYDKWSINIDDTIEPVEYDDPAAAEQPVFVPAIVDLAGDPMIINIGRNPGDAPKTRDLARPDKLSFPGITDEVTLLSDVMLSSSERFMTTIPSTQEDFAFFQAQRSQPAKPMTAADTPEPPVAAEAAPEPEAAPPPVEEQPANDVIPSLTAAGEAGEIPIDADAQPVGVDDQAQPAPVDDAAAAPPTDQASDDSDEGAGWGETVAEGQEALPDFKRTRVEDTTSLAFLVPERDRAQQTEDFFVKVKSNRSLDGVVLEQGFSPEDAKLAGESLKATLDMDSLKAGFVVAMRGFKESHASTIFKLMQVSIYADSTYLGTVARADDGTFVSGADPWVNENLFDYSGETTAEAPKQQYRLLDAIYSTAARNGVPTGVIGEAIMLLSRTQDLNTFANQDDRFILAFSHEPRDDNQGRVLYVAVRGAEKNLECYVFRPQAGGDFACMTDDSQSTKVMLNNGMVTPVNGVMKSTFGPRKHPILNVVRIHKGVDWAAPVGSPVMAAFDGKISFAGDGGDYGNVVKISHSGGRETRYAHMSRFAANTKPGVEVKAGDIIGYVGTTGLSTGPHLHFELYLAGVAIDPLQTAVAAVRSDDSAVEILVDRIIRVESGGSATAKNKLSSATGLGQFIDSTWLRMMRTYRPDLARSLSPGDQLALRFDPTLSREMVTHLAQEGEAYLRARGHAITAGRLYLCHFLGMEGAHVVLSASPDSDLAEVLGAGVIKANPFLIGQNVAHVIDWAERKMSGKRAPSTVVAAAAAPKQVVRASPEFERYKQGVDELVAMVTDGGASAQAASPAASAPAATSTDPAAAATAAKADGPLD